MYMCNSLIPALSADQLRLVDEVSPTGEFDSVVIINRAIITLNEPLLNTQWPGCLCRYYQ
jgi:hypothetical protein